MTDQVTKSFADQIAIALARAGQGWALAQAQRGAAGENAPPGYSISGAGHDDPPPARETSPPSIRELCEHFRNTFALNLVAHLGSLGTLSPAAYGIRIGSFQHLDQFTATPLPALDEAAPGTDSAGSSDEAVGPSDPVARFHIACVRLAALRTEIEDRGTVPDFVRHGVTGTIELLHPLAMAAINDRVLVLPPGTESLRMTTTHELRDLRIEIRVLEGIIADTRRGMIQGASQLNSYIADIETPKGADLATIRGVIDLLNTFARHTDGIEPKSSAATPFAIVVNLLREAVLLAVVGDITPGMDDGIGWGKWMTDAEDTLARLKHVPELVTPPLKPSDFRKSRADFGKSDSADAMAYALAGTGSFGDPLRLHREHVETAPPQEPSDDEGPLMVACDSEYKRGAKDDEHDWCNRTFVARIDGTIVASLNVQGYDDDAFDLARCAVAAWEAPHKSWGPHSADELLKQSVDPRLADRATYLATRLTQAITRLADPDRPAEEGFSIVRDVIAHLQEIGKATTFDADRQQYIDVGNGELWVGDAAFWREKMHDATDAKGLRETYLRLTQQVEHQRQEIGKLHARLGTQDNGAWVSKAMYDEATATLAEVRGMLEKAREDNTDCKTYMTEVFHDTLRWLEGKMEKVPEPDYGVRMEGAKRELNCALAAMGSPASARKYQGMHHAASHLLFGMGWGWRAHEGFWQPGPKAAKVFRDRLEVEELEAKAARFDRLERSCKIDGLADYGRVVHFEITRGSDNEHPHVNYNKPPASLTELADQVKP